MEMKLVPVHDLAYRDITHLRMMARWPRLCFLLGGAVNHDLEGINQTLSTWIGVPILDVQAGPAVLSQWKQLREKGMNEYIQGVVRMRHEIKEFLKQDSQRLLWAYALNWSLVARRAFAPFEEIILSNPPKRRDEEPFRAPPPGTSIH